MGLEIVIGSLCGVGSYIVEWSADLLLAICYIFGKYDVDLSIGLLINDPLMNAHSSP